MTDPQFSSLVPNAELEALLRVVTAARNVRHEVVRAGLIEGEWQFEDLCAALDALDEARGAAVRQMPRSES